MKYLLVTCVVLLLIAIADLPIGYYTLLRIVVTIGAVAVVATELKNGVNFWVLAFGLITIVFNPIIPIYLGGKEGWILIDIITAFLFGTKLYISDSDHEN